MPLTQHQYQLAIRVREAQRRILVKRLYGLAWYDPSDIERINRRIFAVIMRGWL